MKHALTQGGTKASLGSVNWPFVEHQLWNLNVKQLLVACTDTCPCSIGRGCRLSLMATKGGISVLQALRRVVPSQSFSSAAACESSRCGQVDLLSSALRLAGVLTLGEEGAP